MISKEFFNFNFQKHFLHFLHKTAGNIRESERELNNNDSEINKNSFHTEIASVVSCCVLFFNKIVFFSIFLMLFTLKKKKKKTENNRNILNTIQYIHIPCMHVEE